VNSSANPSRRCVCRFTSENELVVENRRRNGGNKTDRGRKGEGGVRRATVGACRQPGSSNTRPTIGTRTFAAQRFDIGKRAEPLAAADIAAKSH
jgi:hypothetical protein